jgi:hypothetical protein
MLDSRITSRGQLDEVSGANEPDYDDEGVDDAIILTRCCPNFKANYESRAIPRTIRRNWLFPCTGGIRCNIVSVHLYDRYVNVCNTSR